MEPVETVLHFIECINARDPDRLVRMMTEDHVFIDSLDARVSGCENMRAGWRGQTPAAWLATVSGGQAQWNIVRGVQPPARRRNTK
jgi:ketosteroid isomerase-like protein